MIFKERDMMSGLAKGLAVIETFSAQTPRQSISQVAEKSGLDRATARRCLLTLAHEGYADWDGKFFTLTPRVLRLGTACLASMPLPQIVQPALDRLSETLGQSASVSVLDGQEIVYIARSAQTKVMSISLMPGTRLPAFCTSMGRVLLAALPKADAESIIAKTPLTPRTPKTIVNAAEISAALNQTRIQGYALIDEEVELGLQSIAVPLHDSHGRIIGALNLGFARSSEDIAQRAALYLPHLLRTTEELQKLIT